MKKKYILLIDDDPDEFDFFLSAINKIPDFFECGYAVSAAAAISLLEDFLPDYIFVDMNMPLVNGIECTKKLKNIDSVSNVPIYIYTTGYDEILKKKALLNGASGCLKKPSKPSLLADILTSLHHNGKP
ncbi:MAG TPA: response regulator [Flavobacterium sp.]|nr:response regulator [Flavobacterium sp.]